MNRYKGKAARWQPKDKEEQRMNKTEFIKVRCTLEEKQRIKSKAESAGRKFSDYCREILLNGEVAACLLYTSPSPRDGATSRMPSSA